VSLIAVAAVMVSTCVAVLGVVIWSALTLAVFDAIPGDPAIVKMVMVAVAPLVIVPSRQVTVPAASEQEPVFVTVEPHITFEGNGSVTVTLVAVLGPVFVTVSV
jgi:uncharacterized protein (DUF58 family)